MLYCFFDVECLFVNGGVGVDVVYVVGDEDGCCQQFYRDCCLLYVCWCCLVVYVVGVGGGCKFKEDEYEYFVEFVVVVGDWFVGVGEGGDD